MFLFHCSCLGCLIVTIPHVPHVDFLEHSASNNEISVNCDLAVEERMGLILIFH